MTRIKKGTWLSLGSSVLSYLGSFVYHEEGALEWIWRDCSTLFALKFLNVSESISCDLKKNLAVTMSRLGY